MNLMDLFYRAIRKVLRVAVRNQDDIDKGDILELARRWIETVFLHSSIHTCIFKDGVTKDSETIHVEFHVDTRVSHPGCVDVIISPRPPKVGKGNIHCGALEQALDSFMESPKLKVSYPSMTTGMVILVIFFLL